VGLEREEGIEFLDQLVGERMNRERKESLVQAVCGSLFFLSMAPEFADQVDDFGNVFPRGRQDDSNEGRQIIGRWLSEITLPTSARVALRALCRLSEIGMSPRTLAHISDATEIDLTTGLCPLFDRQYVRRRRDPVVGIEDEFWVPHDLLRNYFEADVRGDEDRECESRFDTYVGQAVKDGRLPELGLLTMLDMFTVNIRNVFRELSEIGSDLNRHVLFLTHLRERTSFLQEIVNAAPTQAQAERLAVLFRDRLRPEAKYCSTVIPIATCLGNLAPLESVAETAWLGARQEDDWARACSIWAACNHWRCLGPDVKAGAVKQLRQQLRLELESLFKGWSQYGYRQAPDTTLPSDMSLACVFGGLSALGEPDVVVETVSGWQYRSVVPFSILAELTGVVCLIDAKRPRQAVDLWERVRDHSSAAQATHVVCAYGRENGTFLRPPLQSFDTSANSFSRNVADAAQSERLRAFIRTADPQAFPYLSSVV
jgi:hypothetical protein